MSTSTSTKSSNTSIVDIDPTSTPRNDTISRIKQHLKRTQQRWGPLMAAKESWEDEYNFPPGRHAGQDDRPIIRQKSVDEL
ncbi:hypothetical protein N7454_006436 [Penicillium verhagenii]|nr:hypothetical protein N7454_006436 [Penicillium verhagenii]